MKSIATTETVLFYDTDCGGVVSNIAYLRYVERARCELFEALGLALAEMPATGVFPTVIRTEIDYLAAATLGDRIEVRAKLGSVGRVRMECEFELVRSDSENKTVFVRARQTVALVQMPSGRPRRTPEEWRTSVAGSG